MQKISKDLACTKPEANIVTEQILKGFKYSELCGLLLVGKAQTRRKQ